MKISIILVSLATILALSRAQENKAKGAACKESSECGVYKCVEGHCGCKVGHLPQHESHAQDPGSNAEEVDVCVKVVGSGCNHNQECFNHLPNSKCDPVQKTCVCNVDDDCTDGAVTLTVMSLTTMMALVIGMIKVW